MLCDAIARRRDALGFKGLEFDVHKCVRYHIMAVSQHGPLDAFRSASCCYAARDRGTAASVSHYFGPAAVAAWQDTKIAARKRGFQVA